MNLTPLERAMELRDRALSNHAKFSAKAEVAREAWIEYSTQVEILKQIETTSTPAPSISRDGVNAVMRPDPLRGLIAGVARTLGLSDQHVRQVAYGKRVSQKVTEALQLAKRAVEAQENRVSA
jgi:hypothetical protein